MNFHCSTNDALGQFIGHSSSLIESNSATEDTEKRKNKPIEKEGVAQDNLFTMPD